MKHGKSPEENGEHPPGVVYNEKIFNDNKCYCYITSIYIHTKDCNHSSGYYAKFGYGLQDGLNGGNNLSMDLLL